MLSSRFTYMPDPAPNNAAPAPDPSSGGAKTKPRKPSAIELLRDGTEGYKKIWPYIDKYRWRFIASIIAGAGSAIFTVGQAYALKAVMSPFDKKNAATFTTHGNYIDFNFHLGPNAGPTFGHVV